MFMKSDYRDRAMVCNPYLLPRPPRLVWAPVLALTVVNIALTGLAVYLLHAAKLLI